MNCNQCDDKGYSCEMSYRGDCFWKSMAKNKLRFIIEDDEKLRAVAKLLREANEMPKRGYEDISPLPTWAIEVLNKDAK